ncbi:DNA internalization-related competence protein ComEC/Rec2 [Ideonella livida]|uniref:DNA internalization-related competence protein ComEC/Rec2 n=1 Tax=Ideonella livida TaxID=2707176 RepID=A0A7C9TLK7_9BURK|nr:DNA internalization-related competence protein ComEC/Rec2 [Ideonella livida]NDY91647.1 DNA internalization-related competence protein ComEC/Rec2 [Ideonella livida]
MTGPVPSLSPPATAAEPDGAAPPQGVLAGLLLLTLAPLAATWAALQWVELPGPGVRGAWAGLAVAALLGLGAWCRWRGGPPAPPRAPRAWAVPGPGWWLAATAAGALQTLAVAQRSAERLAQRLPAAQVQAPLWLTGRVSGLPQWDAQGLRFEVEVEELRDAAARVVLGVDGRSPPGRVRLSWSAQAAGLAPPGGQAGPQSGTAAGALQAGSRWGWPVRLHPPHGLRNPGGGDAERRDFEAGIMAVGTVWTGAPVAPQWLGPARPWHPLEQLDAARQRWRDAILLRVPDPATAGLLAALAVGDQAAVDPQAWAWYRDTGIAHLVSISGLHITLFAWGAMAVAGRWCRLLPGLPHRVPAVVAGRWAGWALAALYALLAGWGVPAQRTVGMLGLAVALRQGGRGWPGLLQCAVVAAALAVADPWALLAPGFWLSFGAVALLMLGGQTPPATGEADAPAPGRWQRLGRALRAGLRTQWVAGWGLAPLSALCFGQVSLAGLLVNLVAVPWVSFGILPLALAGLLWPTAWDLAHALVAPLHQGLAWAADWPAATWPVPALTPAAWALLLLGGVLAVVPGPLLWRWAALACWLPALWPVVLVPAPGRLELWAFEVGQGAALLVRTGAGAVLVDAGPAWPGGQDAGARVLLPALQALGLGRTGLHTLVVTHQDQDHAGGAAAVLAAWPEARLLATLPPAHPLWRGRAPGSAACQAGQRWTLAGVQFEMLHPEAPPRAGQDHGNAASCVLRVASDAGEVLLVTGDLDQAGELALLQRHGAAGLHATVLILGHHGSRTSSHPDFLAAVAPRWTVAQAGHLNRFGHPAPEVVARVQALGAKLVRTDQCGAWQWRAGHMSCERDRQGRVWTDRHAP